MPTMLLSDFKERISLSLSTKVSCWCWTRSKLTSNKSFSWAQLCVTHSPGITSLNLGDIQLPSSSTWFEIVIVLSSRSLASRSACLAYRRLSCTARAKSVSKPPVSEYDILVARLLGRDDRPSVRPRESLMLSALEFPPVIAKKVPVHGLFLLFTAFVFVLFRQKYGVCTCYLLHKRVTLRTGVKTNRPRFIVIKNSKYAASVIYIYKCIVDININGKIYLPFFKNINFPSL